MKKVLITIAVLLVLMLISAVVLITWTMHALEAQPPAAMPTTPSRSGPDPDNFYLDDSDESDKRAAMVLPNGPSENARQVLGEPPVPPVADAGTDEPDDLPLPAIQWIAEVAVDPKAPVSLEQVMAVDTDAWEKANGLPEVYGLDATTKRWRRPVGGDPAQSFTQLNVAWTYVGHDPAHPFDEAQARRWQQVASQFAAKVHASPPVFSVSPAAAARRAQQLEALKTELDGVTLDIGVKAPDAEPYDGKKAWDVLTCLGLEWGDGDFFHWPNPNPAAGDESFFVVGTNSEPGYLLPEDAASGKLKLGDLRFSLYAPRVHDPSAVLEAMLRATEYTQRRLGGTRVFGDDDAPLDEAKLRDEVKREVDRLKAAGLEPGTKETLLLL